MNNNSSKIGYIESVLMLTAIIICQKLISLPSILINQTENGAIFAIFIGWIMMMIIAYILTKLALNFPDKTILDYSKIILGNTLGKAVTLIFFIYCFMMTSTLLRNFAEFMKQGLLFITPLEFIMLTFIFTTAYCAVSGISVFSKTTNLLISISFIAMLFLILISASFVKFEELLPTIQLQNFNLKNPKIYWGISTFLGIEFMFFLLPHMKNPKDINKSINLALTIALIFFLTDVSFTIGILGNLPTVYQVFPLLDVASVVSSSIIRTDIVFTSIAVLFSFVVTTGYLYLTSYTFANLVNAKSHSLFAILLIPFIFVTALLPQNYSEISLLINFIHGPVWLITTIFIPILIYTIGIVRKKINF